MKIGEKIRRVRELRGIKQISLAKKLGITQQRLSKIERSERVDDTFLSKIAEALKTTPEIIKNFCEEKALSNTTQEIKKNIDSSLTPTAVNDKLIDALQRVIHEQGCRIQLLEKRLTEENNKE